MKVQRQLVLELERHEVSVGRSIVLRVRDEARRPIEDARVSAGTRETRTDSRGLCELQFKSPGFWRIVASKPPTDRVSYESTSSLVRAVPRQEIDRTATPLDSGPT
ncbi:carboxypeptidase-like regulatory domain-containing protein [Halopiger goleimassiliensis]|uniref:carboxypeptidase-like regulatory domain-containing protein n=1 Tax=Halopiger goleimassiliensis TaxID=1293048 RepID=UPI000677C0D5|nr:carboxypeptidase-like regulatory domain-containing protein [Halopiger goleimassiliensis]